MESFGPEDLECESNDWKHEFRMQLDGLPHEDILDKRFPYIICDLSSSAKDNLFFVAYSDDVPINYMVISVFYELRELIYKYRYIMDDAEKDIVGLKKRLELSVSNMKSGKMPCSSELKKEIGILAFFVPYVVIAWQNVFAKHNHLDLGIDELPCIEAQDVYDKIRKYTVDIGDKNGSALEENHQKTVAALIKPLQAHQHHKSIRTRSLYN